MTADLTVDEKIRAIVITPAGDTSIDAVAVKAGASWSQCLHQIASSLETQWYDMHGGAKEWDDIAVKVQCREMTQAEWDEFSAD